MPALHEIHIPSLFMQICVSIFFNSYEIQFVLSIKPWLYDLTLEFGQHTRRNNQTGQLMLALPESTSYSNPHD